MDSNARSLQRFSTAGELLGRLRLEGHIGRIVQQGSNFAVKVLMDSNPFYLMDSTGERKTGFGGFLLDEITNPRALDGSFVNHDGEDVLFVPLNASFLYYYGPASGRERVVQTIDRLPYTGDPAAQPDGVGNVIRAPTWRTRANTRSVDDGIIYLHVLVPDGRDPDSRMAVLDRYDVRSGAYISSTRLPFRPRNALIHGGRVYALGDTTVTVWEFGE